MQPYFLFSTLLQIFDTIGELERLDGRIVKNHQYASISYESC